MPEKEEIEMFGKESEEKENEKVLQEKVEQLGREEVITYKLSESYGGELIHIMQNPDYPKVKGSKEFNLYLEKVEEDGRPVGKKSLFISGNSKEMAAWCIGRDAKQIDS